MNTVAAQQAVSLIKSEEEKLSALDIPTNFVL